MTRNADSSGSSSSSISSKPVKLADADVLGDAVTQPAQPMSGNGVETVVITPQLQENTAPALPAADDENQPGFIGTRHPARP